MKIAIKCAETDGYPFYISEPDKDDPTEKVFNVPDHIAQRWKEVMQNWKQIQDEIEDWYFKHE